MNDNRRKAAVAILSMGKEQGAQVLEKLPPQQRRAVVEELLELRDVTGEEVRQSAQDLTEELAGRAGKLGMLPSNFVSELLDRAVGTQEGELLLSEVASRPFAWYAQYSQDQLAQVLSEQKSSSIALILAALPPSTSAALLSGLAPALRGEVAARVARLSVVSEHALRAVEAQFKDRLEALPRRDVWELSGTKVLAGMLQKAGRDEEREVLRALAQEDSELADQLKGVLFTFDDLVFLPPKSLQALLKAVDTRPLATALSSAGEALRTKLLAQLSERARENLLEEAELLGTASHAELTAARAQVIAVARTLEEQGVLSLSREGS